MHKTVDLHTGDAVQHVTGNMHPDLAAAAVTAEQDLTPDQSHCICGAP